MKRIKLNSRYGEKNYLVLNEDGISYSLKTEYNFRVIFDESKDDGVPNIIAVDPSGGPYLTTGTQVSKNLVVDHFETNRNMHPIRIFLKQKN